MLWHRQAIFESKGDKLSSSAEGRIRTHQGLRHQIAIRLNARWQTDWAIEDQAKNLNSTARPYDQRAFSPLDPTAVWHSHLARAIYMFVVVNFDALAQASDIRIEGRQVVFLCWRQDSNPSGSQTPNRQQTELIPQVWGQYMYCCTHSSKISERSDKKRGPYSKWNKFDRRTDRQMPDSLALDKLRWLCQQQSWKKKRHKKCRHWLSWLVIGENNFTYCNNKPTRRKWGER